MGLILMHLLMHSKDHLEKCKIFLYNSGLKLIDIIVNKMLKI